MAFFKIIYTNERERATVLDSCIFLETSALAKLPTKLQLGLCGIYSISLIKLSGIPSGNKLLKQHDILKCEDISIRNMFGSSSVAFCNLQCLRKSFEKVHKSSESFHKGPSGLFWNIFGNGHKCCFEIETQV